MRRKEIFSKVKIRLSNIKTMTKGGSFTLKQCASRLLM